VPFLESLQAGTTVIAAELRPPRAELGSAEGMDAWIDTYHAVRALTRQRVPVFLTDSAVGTQEENNLRHLVTNLGRDLPRDPALVVLGGDRTLGRQRCVEHAWELRREIRRREPHLELGGWANPYADARRQVDYLMDAELHADFYLTQVVSHLDTASVAAFVEETRRRRLEMPGMFGVFYYRSANPRTLEQLSRFLPVPVAALTSEFGAGASAVEVCARTLRAMIDLGARHFYISNLPLDRAPATLNAILERVGALA
jgi:hypothetical protein